MDSERDGASGDGDYQDENHEPMMQFYQILHGRPQNFVVPLVPHPGHRGCGRLYRDRDLRLRVHRLNANCLCSVRPDLGAELQVQLPAPEQTQV